MAFKYRDENGWVCSKEAYIEKVKAGLIEPGENMELDAPASLVLDMSLTKEEMESTPASVLEKMQGMISAMFNGPVLGNMVQINRDAGALAIRNRIGGAANSIVREKIARPLLPASLHPYVLDNPLGSGLLDLGVSNTGMALLLMFGQRMPDRMFQGGMALARCMTTAAYSQTFGAWNPEEFMGNFLSGDLMTLTKEAMDLRV